MTNRFLFLAGASLFLAPAVASAQTAPAPAAGAPAAAAAGPAVGATITDSAGVPIGTVESVTPQAIVVASGTSKVALPPAAIGKTAKGFALSMTKAELDAAQAQQQQAATAAVKSQLVAGAKVNGLNGTPLGTVKSSDGTNVTLTTPNGEAVVPATGFAAGPNNTIVLGLTAQQLSAMLGGAKAGAATTATTGTTAGTTTSAPAATTTGTTTTGTTTTGTAATGTMSTDASATATGGTTETSTTTTTTPTTKKTTTKTTTKKKTRR